jgi:hypothetical protein
MRNQLELSLKAPILAAALTFVGAAHAQSLNAASLPYMPTWQSRHSLQLLADQAALLLPVTHWPLPANAVRRAIESINPQGELAEAKQLVQRELDAMQSKGQLQLHLRTPSEGLPGFGDNYTPGTSGQLLAPELKGGDQSISYAARLGGKFEEGSNSLSSANSGIGTDKAYQLRPEGSAFVASALGWNLQATSQRYWWGPGWQSSMVNGSNNPAWTGLGLQRASAAPSASPWLAWMGPWNFDVFFAKAQDPIVVTNQPSGFVYSGMRLTLKPQPWLEVGLSRGLQAGGAGRPSGLTNLVKSFFGQEVNHNPGDPVDTSGQIAGYDARISCPQALAKLAGGTCAAYTQWMGEDAAGQIPLPFKFMSLWGFENTYANGRYRTFVEYINTNAYSLPWDNKPTFPGYVNGVYSQGYTQGARWVGPAAGSGSRITTVGWMDTQTQTSLRLHWGTTGSTIGAYDPSAGAGPSGKLRGLSASRSWHYKGMTLTPELAYTHLSVGHDVGSNLKTNTRVGLTVQVPMTW